MVRRVSTTTTTHGAAAAAGDDDDDDVLEQQRRSTTSTTTSTTTTTRGGCAVYDVLNPHLSAREVMRRRGYEVKDHLKENAQKIRAQSERNAASRRRLAEEEEEVRRRGRRRGERTTTTSKSSSLTSPPCESRVRADLEEAAKRGAKRVAAVEQRARAARPTSFGTTPKYLAERKATLLRELNEKMERALEDIEKRRTERALERQLELAERRKRDAERRARLERRARVDAEKLSPIERAQRAKNVETARLLFARAHLRVDDFLPPPPRG